MAERQARSRVSGFMVQNQPWTILIQRCIHAYNDHTFILRENKAINYEGAFMYLFFGNGVAMLIDQGSTSSPALFPLREVVDEIIQEWEEQHQQSDIELMLRTAIYMATTTPPGINS